MRSYILVALLFCGSLPVSSETNHAGSMLSATLAKYANPSTYPEGTAIVNALQKINPSFSSGAALCQYLADKVESSRVTL